ncbi:TIGR04219 family outer membrane beta-barrel protein [uncultured Desulfosarcina sp.]|uniref:TIGR04219 family outer membrane beta-barrel protein n=1 Tax=uncultured Desulfosarcina sp. TaxID=218289 RepID=UPI0029C907E3|nr:TIGR04219 family outer membrane beta-barrel protein [uncultured Desulfosarcina sp.]
MQKIKLLVMTFLVVLTTTASAGAAGVEFAVGGWIQEPSGSLGYKILSDNDILDVERDLGYDSESRITGRLKIDMPLMLPNIYLMATPMEFKAMGRKEGGFKFGDVFFDPGPFETEIVLDNFDFGLYYGFPLLETATFDTLNIDIGLNIRFYDYDLRVWQASTGLNESENGIIPLPMVFLAVQLRPLDWLSFEAEGRGISYSGNDVYSLIGRVKFNFAGPFFVAGGYRYEKVDLDEKDVLADIEISGPFLEAGFSF